MSQKKELKESDVTQLVRDIYCSEERYTIKEVIGKVSEWLKNENESKDDLAYEIYDLVLMLTKYEFNFNLVKKIVHESKELFVDCKPDFSLMIKDNSWWHIEVVGTHPMIQQDYEEFNTEIMKHFKNEIFTDPIIISNNYNSYYKKPNGNILDNNTDPETYNYNCMRLNFWQNYFVHLQISIKDAPFDAPSKLIDLCKKDAQKVRDYVVKNQNEIIEQLNQIITYSNTKDISGIKQQLETFLQKVEHKIISRNSYNLEDYFKYIYEQIKQKFQKQYRLKDQQNTRGTLLVSVQIVSHAEDCEIIAGVEKHLLKKLNCDKPLKSIFFQEIYILSKLLIKLKIDGDSGWKLIHHE